MAELRKMIIMGNIYDPDTDTQMILMKVSPKDWEDYQNQLDDEKEGAK